MAFLGIDHLVIAVPSPEAAAAALEQDLGLAFTGAGRHAAMGTHNRLAFLGDSYLELIGVFDRDLVRSSPGFAVAGAALERLESRGEGLATYALASDDLAGDVARLTAAGSPIGPPVAGSRIRPDGETVRWLTAFPELGQDRPPFLIEHELAGPEWGAPARKARAAFLQPVGGRVRLVGLGLPAADPSAVARIYRATLGIEFSASWRAIVGSQSIGLVPDTVGLPVVHLAGEADSPTLDLVRVGIRWRREPRMQRGVSDRR